MNVHLTNRPLPPAPDVPVDELAERLQRVRTEMQKDGVDVLVLSDKKNVDFFTNYQTMSWAYKARPVFAAISESEFVLFGSLTESKVVEQRSRAFAARYYNGYLPEAVGAIGDWIKQTKAGQPHIAIDYGQDMLGRGSLELIECLSALGAGRHIKSAVALLWRVRMIKSSFEAGLKRIAFDIVNKAFDQTIAETRIGIREFELCQRMQAQIFLNGAESADPIAMLFADGVFAYGNPPSHRQLRAGHYVWTDFRATYGGYPADRNRIARAGEPTDWEVETYSKTRGLTIELCQSIRAGMTCGEVYDVFERLWAEASLGKVYSAVSRIGHGGGLDVTEPPSIARGNDEIIRPGMILHLEPKLERDGAVFQFEEVIFVRDEGIEFLSELSPERVPVIV